MSVASASKSLEKRTKKLALENLLPLSLRTTPEIAATAASAKAGTGFKDKASGYETSRVPGTALPIVVDGLDPESERRRAIKAAYAEMQSSLVNKGKAATAPDPIKEFAAAGKLGLITATDEDFKYELDRTKVLETQEYLRFIQDNYDSADPEAKKWLEEVAPEYFQVQEDWLRQVLERIAKLAKLRMRGIKDEDDILFLYKVAKGEILIPKREIALFDPGSAAAADEDEFKDRYRYGAFSLLRLFPKIGEYKKDKLLSGAGRDGLPPGTKAADFATVRDILGTNFEGKEWEAATTAQEQTRGFFKGEK